MRTFLLSSVFSRPVFAQPGEGGAEPPAGGGNEPPADGGNEPPAGGAEPPAGGNEPPAAPPAGEKTDWRDREIARKHAQLQEKNRRIQEQEAELEAARALLARGAGGAEPPAAPPAAGAEPPAAPARRTEQPPQDAVRREAARMRAEEKFAEDSNAADKKGRETYGAGWTKATETLAKLGGFSPEDMANILATDDPAKVIHELGANPEKYQDIMALPPQRRFAEMVKLSMAPAPAPAPKPSGAPAPTEPVGQRRTVQAPVELKDDLADEEWYAIRGRQKEERFRARRAGR